MRILAIDPGREKCGLVVAERTVLVDRAVVPLTKVPEAVRGMVSRLGPERIILGDRTGAEDLRRSLMAIAPSLPIILVPEQGTTMEARRRYFLDHPPAGWRRLLPQSLQVPPRAYDDYAAAVLAERYFAGLREGV